MKAAMKVDKRAERMVDAKVGYWADLWAVQKAAQKAY